MPNNRRDFADRLRPKAQADRDARNRAKCWQPIRQTRNTNRRTHGGGR